MMVGKVTVPMAATGSVKDGWKLRWLVGENPKGRTYDVQKRRAGTKTWSLFRNQTTTGRAGSTLARGPGRYGRAPSRRTGRRAGRRR